jgi:hypothetical protein
MPGSKLERAAGHRDAVRFCKAEFDTNGDDAFAILRVPATQLRKNERYAAKCWLTTASEGSTVQPQAGRGTTTAEENRTLVLLGTIRRSVRRVPITVVQV